MLAEQFKWAERAAAFLRVRPTIVIYEEMGGWASFDPHPPSLPPPPLRLLLLPSEGQSLKFEINSLMAIYVAISTYLDRQNGRVLRRERDKGAALALPVLVTQHGALLDRPVHLEQSANVVLVQFLI